VTASLIGATGAVVHADARIDGTPVESTDQRASAVRVKDNAACPRCLAVANAPRRIR
jgi:hypothetical protein